MRPSNSQPAKIPRSPESRNATQEHAKNQGDRQALEAVELGADHQAARNGVEDVERAQKRLGLAKIDRKASDDIADLNRDAGRSRFDNDFKYSSESMRGNAGKTGALDIESGKQGRVQGQLQSQLSKEQKTIDDYSSGASTDKSAYEGALPTAGIAKLAAPATAEPTPPTPRLAASL